MKPPICELCGRAFWEELAYRHTGGDTVEFGDYAPLPRGLVGHPEGLVWLCDRHLAAGRALAALSWPAARERMTREFGQFAPHDPAAALAPELWVEAVGSRRDAVLAVVREAVDMTPAQAHHALAGDRFRVMTGPAAELEPWRVKLVDAGADAGIRFP